LPLLAAFLPLCGFWGGTRAQTPPRSAAEFATDLIDSGETHKAVAVLAAGARETPQDRLIGSLLYSTLRDHLWHMPQCQPVVHDSPVRAVAFSPDNAWLASGSDLGKVIVSATDPADPATFELKHGDEIVGLAFSADGKRLAVAAQKIGVRIWDVATRQSVFLTPNPATPVTAFAVSNDGLRFAIGLENGAAQIFDFAGAQLGTFRHAGRIEALQFSRDGLRLASASADKTARTWDAKNGQPLGPAIKHRGTVHSVDFSTDGHYVLTGSADKTARLSDVRAGVPVMKASDCAAAVLRVRMSPDGSHFLAMLDDRRVLLWDALTGQQTDIVLRKDADFLSASWSRSGLRLLTASANGKAMIWSSFDGQPFGEPMPHDGPVLALVVSPNGKIAATASSDGKARLWRIDGGKALPTIRLHAGRPRTAFYSPSGDILVTASEDHTAQRWKSGQVRAEFPPLRHAAAVTCGVFSPDETLILTSCEDGHAQLWSVETGEKFGAAFAHEAPVAWVDFHPEGKQFVAAAGPSAVVWTIADRTKPLKTLTPEGGGAIHTARFSPDGKWLAIASEDGALRVWDCATWQLATPAIQREGAVRCARFSPDGKRLAFTGDDHQVVTLDTTTWQPVAPPIVLPGPGYSVAVTDDNRFIVATGFLLNGVRCFEIATARPIGLGYAIDGQALSVDYMVSDKVIVLTADDNTVRALDSPFTGQDVPRWMPDFAQKVVGLELTETGSFVAVPTDASQLQRFVFAGAQALNADFAWLAKWLLGTGAERTGMPRFDGSIASDLEKRVEERSLALVYECYNAAPGHPLVLAALSLYTPNGRQSEFLADHVLARAEADPLAQAYAAAALVRAGRSTEGLTVMDRAVAAAPNNVRVLRRQAKVNARLGRFDLASSSFARALEAQPNDYETLRSYAWVLYNMGSADEALKLFRKALSNEGTADPDLIAGICLCADATGLKEEAIASYQRLIAIDGDWKDATYLDGLSGWTAREITALHRLRLAALQQ